MISKVKLASLLGLLLIIPGEVLASTGGTGKLTVIESSLKVLSGALTGQIAYHVALAGVFGAVCLWLIGFSLDFVVKGLISLTVAAAIILGAEKLLNALVPESLTVDRAAVEWRLDPASLVRDAS